FPAVVTAEEWALARAGQEQRQGRDRRGRVLARSERKHVNLFRGLLTHAPDGEGFFFQPGTTAKKVRHAVLRSKAGSDSRGKEVTFPYLVFEEAVLSLLAEVDPKEVLRQDKAPSRAEVIRAQLANVRSDIASIQADLKAGYSKALTAVLRDK